MADGPRHTSPAWTALGLVAGGLVLAFITALVGREGVVLSNATDHLRHMAEATAWGSVGWSMYRVPFSEVLARSLPACEAHRGLWEAQPAVVPPLAIFLHAPAAFAEARGLLSPAHAHAAQGALLSFFAGVALMLALRLGRQESPFGLTFVLLTFAPLLVGTSFSAFVDTAWVLAIVVALWAWRQERWAGAVAAFALAGALHVRAGVFVAPAIAVTATS